MTALGPADPLPRLPRRILVAGTSGSGKTTVAARIAGILGIEHHELDALHHGPGWTVRPTFTQDVHRFAAAPTWVTEWQYADVRPQLAARADLLVWLDLPRSQVMRQIIARTVRRRTRREVLWNGNTEAPLWTFFTDPDHIVRFAWATHSRRMSQIAAVGTDNPSLTVVRLHTRRDVTAWLANLTRTAQ